MYLRYRLIAAELRSVGIDVNCAPGARPDPADTRIAVLRNRCYGGDPAEVAAIGRAVAEGLLAGGVLPVMKHMPGQGRAALDSHLDLPVVTADRAALAADFAPFRALADLPMAMTAHVVYAALDAEAPATQSPAVVRLMREEIGFGGLLMTDDLSMKALKGSFAERVRRRAGGGLRHGPALQRRRRRDGGGGVGRAVAGGQGRRARRGGAGAAPGAIRRTTPPSWRRSSRR